MSKMETDYRIPVNECSEKLRICAAIEGHDLVASHYQDLDKTPDTEENQEMKEILRNALKETLQKKADLFIRNGYRSSKKIRTPVRRAATELSNSIKIEIEKENASSDLIEELLSKLIDKEKLHENFNKDITILTNMADIEKEIEKQQQYRDSIITCKVQANKILNKRETE
ncbi:uncharacterized protein TNIN_422061 [Trichonephila inaurata madagascariensis]|uniref:Uncharacterized protein n=1 Tax=Trichonephila inaurata madagascariensis TaxID=2747483 RepID=A0A8X6YXT9_9ARAC|nr:uncharacterized protein TNIN_422061 [Trichonephila inaurata madagascariensis]